VACPLIAHVRSGALLSQAEVDPVLDTDPIRGTETHQEQDKRPRDAITGQGCHGQGVMRTTSISVASLVSLRTLSWRFIVI
jgi:hypothetical protein